MKQKHFIDSHKGITGLVILGLMAYFERWDNMTAWAYLATHGVYGLLWAMKSRAFPDKSWEATCGLGYGFVIWGSLSLYWIAPYLITSGNLHAPPWLIGICVASFSFGVFLHFAADMQKHIQLAHAPGLITDGLWARSRNPNYLGELLIYGGFSALAMHWAPLVALGLFFVVVWVPNMLKKDKSLSRYPEFDAYARRSGLFFPRFR
ncbi:MAG: DUF1295 domain-containing protein [Myxococcota bacterium]|nr:DUF1295 domain-containing protein [Myxococcota bacterium]